MKSSVFRSWVTLLLCISLVTPGYGWSKDLPSQEEWDQILAESVDWTIDFYYLRLGKSYDDASLLLARQAQFYSIELALLESQVSALVKDAQVPAKESAALRDASWLKSQALKTIQKMRFTKQSLEKLRALQVMACSEKQVSEFSSDFSVSSIVGINEQLRRINQALQNVLEGKSETFSIEMKIASSTDTSNSQTSTSLDSSSSAMMTRITTAVGMGIGSSIGAAGTGATAAATQIGSMVGGAIGLAVVGIIGFFFGETPKAEWQKLYRQQKEYITTSVGKLEGKGISNSASNACIHYLDSDATKTLSKFIDNQFAQLTVNAETAFASVSAGAKSIQTLRQENAEELAFDTLPFIRKIVDSRFEQHLAEVSSREDESRKFASERIAPHLKKILGGKSDNYRPVDVEENLWNGLVEGDALYSQRKAFGFQTVGQETGSLPSYWDSTSAAILTKLNSLQAKESKP